MTSLAEVSKLFQGCWSMFSDQRRLNHKRNISSIYTSNCQNQSFSCSKPALREGVRIRSFSALYLVGMRENTDQKNSEYEHFLRSTVYHIFYGTHY